MQNKTLGLTLCCTSCANSEPILSSSKEELNSKLRQQSGPPRCFNENFKYLQRLQSSRCAQSRIEDQGSRWLHSLASDVGGVWKVMLILLVDHFYLLAEVVNSSSSRAKSSQ